MARSASLTLLLLSLLAVEPALALGEGVEAGLIVDRSHLDFRSGAETRTSRLTFFLAEEVQPWLSLNLNGGPVLLTQRGNPATAGMDLTGYHIGVGARAEWFRQQPLGLAAGVSYDYLRVDDELDERETTITLHEARGELAALVRTSFMQLQLGGYALYLDGDETTSGPVASSSDIEADKTFGGFAQADFRVDWTGRISLRLEAGASQAASLTFARRF